MTDPKVTAGFYPLLEGDVETSKENIFTATNINNDIPLSKHALKENGNEANKDSDKFMKSDMGNPASLQVNSSIQQGKHKISVNAGKGAINYMQLPN